MSLRTAPSTELDEIRSLARPLRTRADLDPLLERIGDAHFVLLGEASHGTAEYYGWRAALSRRLIAERGFDFVAVEGDWPDCFRVNRWLKGRLHAERTDPERTAREILSQFERWPTWMWANEEVEHFVEWLRRHNRATQAGVGFYGLDVYSLWDSMHEVLDYLAREQPDALPAARDAYRCFEPYAEDPQRYAWATRMVPSDCADEVVELLVELRRRAMTLDGDPEAGLDALQNAEVLAGAERYYRAMVRADNESWNVRDVHMADTLDRLAAHHGAESKAIVWAHNTHVGDARATDMAHAGMVNIGQLARERHHDDGVVLVGFGGHHGTVIAAQEWGGRMERMPVPDATPGTHEQLLHDAVGTPGLFVFPTDATSDWLRAVRGHRAVGVVYRPGHDRYGNWVPTVLGRRYDSFCYFDDTSAVHPLHAESPQPHAEHETYPWNQ
jgi:erythromycin esterase